MRAAILTLALLLAGTAAAAAQMRPDPGGSPDLVASGGAGGIPTDAGPMRSAVRCLEPPEGPIAIQAIEFEGRRFEPAGSPEPIVAENLEPLGQHRGLPLFAGKLSVRPLVDVWVPVCAPADHYQLFTRPAPGHASAGS